MKDAFIGFRAPEQLKARLKALADKNDRTLSQMAVILLREALANRECSEAIRAVDGETAQAFMARLEAE